MQGIQSTFQFLRWNWELSTAVLQDSLQEGVCLWLHFSSFSVNLFFLWENASFRLEQSQDMYLLHHQS